MYGVNENAGLMLPVVFPVVAGVLILLTNGFGKERKKMLAVVLGTLFLETALVMYALVTGGSVNLWQMTDSICLAFGVDHVSRLFAGLTAGVWLLAGIYSVSYMKHEHEEYGFFGFYLIVLGVLIGLDFSKNLITMYVFYELMTLPSLPLLSAHEAPAEGTSRSSAHKTHTW